MRNHMTQLFVAGLVIALLAGTGLAGTTTLYNWQMGENDAGATVGGTASTIYNDAGTGFGSAYNSGGKAWSSDVPTLSKTGTTMSVDYDASTQGFGYVADGFNVGNVSAAMPNDNFGFELWVRKDNTTPTGDRTIFSIGYAGDNNGVELRHNATSFYMNVPAVGMFLVGAHTTDWMHIALVRDDGTLRLFLDGDETFTGAHPIFAPGTLVGFGANYYSAAVSGTPFGFDGKIDDVRIFSFEAGQFVAPTLDGEGNVINGGDLNIVPEPATMGLLGLGGLALLRRRGR